MNTMGVGHELTGVRLAIAVACILAPGGGLCAQDASNTKQILERLDRLERQNAELIQEVHQLRNQLKNVQPAAAEAQPPTTKEPVADAVAIQQSRIDELAQSKVEAAHKLPIRITGMVLFNAFDFSHADAGLNGGTVPVTPGRAEAGGTLSQSIIGLEYWDPDAVLGGKVHGSVYMDLFGNANPYNPYAPAPVNSTYWWPSPRLRTGSIAIDWRSTSVTAGIDKPLIAPLSPDSLAQVAVPPLAGAGNLWLWQPQVRLEERVHLTNRDMFRLQTALYGTREAYAYVPPEYAATVEPMRPGWEGRFAFEHETGDETGFQIAPGFHFSRTHVAGQSVASHIFSVDGRVAMMHWWNLAGSVFTGQNLSGVGGAGPGFVLDEGLARPVHATGGWAQLTLAPTERLSFHLFGGEQTNHLSDVEYNAIGSNAAFAGNVYYQLAPNVFAAFEAGQVRTDWTQRGKRLRNQYDLSLAYLF